MRVARPDVRKTIRLDSDGLTIIHVLPSGNTKMRNQVDFAKSNLISNINLKYISFALLMNTLLQIIGKNSIKTFNPSLKNVCF